MPVTRKSFTDRLGLPASATNAQVFAALDRKLSRAAVASPASAEEALYAKLFEPADTPKTEPVDDALYDRIFGSARS